MSKRSGHPYRLRNRIKPTWRSRESLSTKLDKSGKKCDAIEKTVPRSEMFPHSMRKAPGRKKGEEEEESEPLKIVDEYETRVVVTTEKEDRAKLGGPEEAVKGEKVSCGSPQAEMKEALVSMVPETAEEEEDEVETKRTEEVVVDGSNDSGSYDQNPPAEIEKLLPIADEEEGQVGQIGLEKAGKSGNYLGDREPWVSFTGGNSTHQDSPASFRGRMAETNDVLSAEMGPVMPREERETHEIADCLPHITNPRHIIQDIGCSTKKKDPWVGDLCDHMELEENIGTMFSNAPSLNSLARKRSSFDKVCGYSVHAVVEEAISTARIPRSSVQLYKPGVVDMNMNLKKDAAADQHFMSHECRDFVDKILV